MKKYILLYLCLPLLSYSQEYDRKWLLGYWDTGSGIPYGINELSFSDTNIQITWLDYKTNFATTNTALFDSVGEVLFYSNGLAIWNPNKDTMLNGSGLSPGAYTTAVGEYGLYIPQGLMALPSPAKKGEYYLFHETLVGNNVTTYSPQEINYSVIDMNLNSGLGIVTSKNNSILPQNDTLAQGITACKHANGHDWWIIVPRFSGEAYYRWLLSPSGVQGPWKEFTNTQQWAYNCAAQAVFSPDGSKYIRYRLLAEFQGEINIFDFDRCTGLLSNLVTIPVQLNAGEWVSSGLAISSNSKVLYHCVSTRIFQYDLTASNIADTQYLVANYDGYQSPLGSTFYLAQLAPNGKIYINCTNSEDVLHVINFPDSLGAACDFQQHGIQLLSYNVSLPNHPNYYLGALVGSGCDTLTSVGQPIAIANIYAYPNPTKDKVFIGGNHLGNSTVLSLCNSLGQEIYYHTWENTQLETSISMEDIPQGIYFLSSRIGDELVTAKIVVIH